MGRKRKLKEQVEEDEGPQEIDLPPTHLTVSHLRKEEKRLIVILENAQLETAKVCSTFKLINLLGLFNASSFCFNIYQKYIFFNRLVNRLNSWTAMTMLLFWRSTKGTQLYVGPILPTSVF